MSLSIFCTAIYMTSTQFSPSYLGLGVLFGAIFGVALIGLDLLFKRFSLKAFNLVALGIFLGLFMGESLIFILKAIVNISATSQPLSSPTLEMAQVFLLLLGVYSGIFITLRSSEEIHISIPFIKFSSIERKKKDLLIDVSLLSDARILDLASSGLLDSQMVLPRFIVKDLYAQSESLEEQSRVKAKKSLEIIKKLEELPDLEFRYSDVDFPETKNSLSKMIRLARLQNANIITADMSQVQIPAIEGVRFINLHELAKAMKPLMQMGEHLTIKIQRYGKEPKQGVGYLEDGTMVVVNGGGEFVGEVVDAQVLSVKHTASGRMVFCNALTEKDYLPSYNSHEEEE